jgi:hypothetical protein
MVINKEQESWFAFGRVLPFNLLQYQMSSWAGKQNRS